MKRQLLLFSALITVIFVLVACGGSTSKHQGIYYLYENGIKNETEYIELKKSKWNDSLSSGTYQITDDEIILYIEYEGIKMEILTGKINDGIITVSVLGSTAVYAKEGKMPEPLIDADIIETNSQIKKVNGEYTILFAENINKLNLEGMITVTEGSGWYLSKTSDGSSKLSSKTINLNTDSLEIYVIIYDIFYDKTVKSIPLKLNRDKSFTVNFYNSTSIDREVFDSEKVKNNEYLSYDPEYMLYEPTGYEFDYWSLDINGYNQIDISNYRVTRDINLFPNFKPIEYTAILITDDSYNFQEIKIKYDNSFSIPIPDPKAGYRFEGWLYNGNLITDEYGSSLKKYTIANNIELIPSFIPGKYKASAVVENDKAGKIISGPIYPTSYYYLDTVKLAVETTPGYSFEGWYLEDNLVSDQEQFEFEMPAKDVVYTARFYTPMYKITYDLGSDGVNDSRNQVEYHRDSNNLSLYDPSRDNFDFDGWYINNRRVTEIVPSNYLSNITVVASFSPHTYDVRLNRDYEAVNTISFNPNGGNGSIVDVKVTTTNGLTMPQEPQKSGYQFMGWYTNQQGTGNIFNFNQKINNDIMLYAKWEENPTWNYRSIVNNSQRLTNTLNGSSYSYLIIIKQNESVTFSESGYASYQSFSIQNKNGSSLFSYRSSSYTLSSPGIYQLTIHTSSYYSYDSSFNINYEKPTISLYANEVDEQPINYYAKTYLPTPIKKGFSFEGWYTERGGLGTQVTDSKGYTLQPWTLGSIDLYPKYTKATYKINYNTITGTKNDPSNITEYETLSNVIYLNEPVNDNYIFEGWYLDENYKTEITEIIAGYWGDINIYGKFTPIDYGITYNLNGGINSTNPTSYNIETNTITLNSPTKTGYEFLGWYKDIGFKEKVTQIQRGSQGDMNLYARFEIATYKINYILDDATNDSRNPLEYQYYDSTKQLYNPSKEHYTFDGWYKDLAFTNPISQITSNSTGDITIVAKFTPIKYTVTFNLNGGIGQDKIDYDVKSGATLVKPSRTGYDFIGWFDSPTGGNQVEKINLGVGGNITLYARYELINYKVEYVLSGGSNDERNVDTFKYTDNLIQLYNPKRENYTFMAWYSNANFTGNVVTNINPETTHQNIKLYAKFEPDLYEISFESSGGSPVGRIIYNTEQTVTLPSTSRTGYEFLGWFDQPVEGNEIKRIEVGTSGNKTFYAQYKLIEYSINYNLDGGNNHTNNPLKYTYNSDAITLLQPEKANYDFLGWFNTNNEEVKVITAQSVGDINISARFSPRKFEINYNSMGGNDISNDTYTFDLYKSIDVTPSKTGYTFMGWYDKEIQGNRISEVLVGQSGSIDLYARWELTEYSIDYRLNGGTQNILNKNKYYYTDETFELHSPTKTGYDFLGWYLTEQFSGSPITKIENSHKNLILYAKWGAITYEVIFENEGTQHSIKNYTIEKTLTFPSISKSGYTFEGWYDMSEGGNKVIDLTPGNYGNKHYYARWNLVTYTITYNLNGGQLETPNALTYTIEDNVIFNNPTRHGYEFAGWYTATSGGNIVLGINKGTIYNKTYYARWITVQYEIIYELDGGTNNSSNSGTYNIETTRTLYKPTKTGYTFDGWYTAFVEGNLVGSITAGTTGSFTLYARFSPIAYELTLRLENGIFENELDNITSYTIEDEVVLPIPTRLGYKFDGWAVNNSTSSRVEKISKNSTGSKTYYARWEIEEYEIEYIIGNGINDESNVDQYNVTEHVTLYDPSRLGYTFDGWYDNADFLGEKIVLIPLNSTGNKTLYAKFNPNPHYIRFITSSESEQISMLTVYTDEYFTLPIPKREFYSFRGWCLDIGRTELYNNNYMSPEADEEIILYDLWILYDIEVQSGPKDDPALPIDFTTRNIEEMMNLLQVEMIDTDNNNFDFEFESIPQNIISGQTIDLNIIARSKRENIHDGIIERIIEVKGIRIYDIPTLTVDNELVNISEITEDTVFTASDFNAKAIDSFDEEVDVYVRFSGPKIPGETIDIIIYVYDAAQNYQEFIIKNVKVYGKPNLSYDDEVEAIVFENELSFEEHIKNSIGLVIIDSFGVSIENCSINVLDGYFYGISELVRFEISAVDSMGNTASIITKEFEVYGLPTISYNDTVKEIYFDNDPIEAFEALGIDSFNNTVEITYEVIENTLTAGQTVSIRFKAIDKLGQVQLLTIDNIKVYGSPIINKNEVDYIKEDDLEDSNEFYDKAKDIFEIIVKDDFNEELTFDISHEVSEDKDSLKITIVATNKVNITTTLTFDVSIYSAEGITYEISSDLISRITTKSKGEEFKLTAYDKFGDEITNIKLLDLDGQPVDGGTKTNIIYRLIDKAGNYKDVTIANEVSIYDKPNIKLANPDFSEFDMNTNILKSWFVVKDSFESQLVPTIEIVKGSINEPGEITIKVSASSIGYKNEVEFTFIVLEVFEINFEIQGVINQITLNEKQIDSYILENPAIEHYIFIGWYYEDEKLESLENIRASITLEARFKPVQYEITYEMVELPEDAIKEFTIESELELPVAKREGYKFVGWQVNGYDITATNTNELPLEDVELAAIFEVVTYEITYGIIDLPEDAIKEFTIESELELPVAEREGYKFIGWQVNGYDITATNTNELPLEDVELAAIFEVVTYEITYGIIDLPEDAIKEFTIESELELPVAEREGYKFIGWQVNGYDITATNTNELPLENVKLVAIFEVVTYEITYGIIDLPEDAIKEFTIESELELPVAEREGYKFVGWQVNGYDITATNTNELPLEDVELAAIFEVVTYEITYGIIDLPEDAIKEFTIESELELPVAEREGYKFVGWQVNGYDITATNTNELPLEDVELAAIFEVVTYEITYGIIDLPEDAIKEFTIESELELPVAEREGYKFIGWQVNGYDITATKTDELPLENVELVAVWEEVQQ